ncbi:unnamed protein product [Clavelina lepadiformis]|uniref:Uncharacterized protein n=1 Tax=Clavelina lepadiformis TaxID=159417 RepID=A0ABP0FD99_CLALP
MSSIGQPIAPCRLTFASLRPSARRRPDQTSSLEKLNDPVNEAARSRRSVLAACGRKTGTAVGRHRQAFNRQKGQGAVQALVHELLCWPLLLAGLLSVRRNRCEDPTRPKIGRQRHL